MNQRWPDYNSIAHKDFQFLCMDYVRFVLALLVVLFHAFALSSISAFSDIEYPLIGLVSRVLDAFLAHTIVPVYSFISGYLFFLLRNGTKRFILTKSKRGYIRF